MDNLIDSYFRTSEDTIDGVQYVHYDFTMKEIRITATKARQQFFSLLDLASKGVNIVITKNDLGEEIILSRRNDVSKDERIKRNLELAERAFGSIKTTGYKPNEFELAKEFFVKEYKKKHGIK